MDEPEKPVFVGGAGAEAESDPVKRSLILTLGVVAALVIVGVVGALNLDTIRNLASGDKQAIAATNGTQQTLNDLGILGKVTKTEHIGDTTIGGEAEKVYMLTFVRPNPGGQGNLTYHFIVVAEWHGKQNKWVYFLLAPYIDVTPVTPVPVTHS